jgi:hypothetical protein
VAKKTGQTIDVTQVIRQELDDWFVGNRKELELAFRRAATPLEEENAALREEIKRLRSLLAMVRSQVVEEAAAE